MTTDDLQQVAEEAKTAARNQAELARTAAAAARDKPSRREASRIALRIAVMVSALGAVVAIGVSVFAVHEIATTAAEQQSRDAISSQEQGAAIRTAQQAYTEAQKANQTLATQGKPQVSVPSPQPQNATNTIISAAAAQVLASLPANVGVPSAQQLGQAIAGYITANPQGPTAAQIAAQVSTYFAANADQFKGAQGDQGTPGDPGQTGPQGVGILSVQLGDETTCPDGTSACYPLTVTLTDGSQSVSTLQIPPGPVGPTGATGPPPATYTVQVPGLTGPVTETCTRTNTDDTNPTYGCQ